MSEKTMAKHTPGPEELKQIILALTNGNLAPWLMGFSVGSKPVKKKSST